MYFEKGPAKPTEAVPPVSTARRWWIYGGGVIGLAVIGFFVYRFLTDAEPLLRDARRLLVSRGAELDSAVPLRTVRRAEEALQTYLGRAGHAQDSAKLLLLVCRWQTGRMDGTAQELQQIHLAACQASEVTAAALAAFQANDFPTADRLITAALERTGTDRERVLRAASVIRFDTGRREEVLEHCRELAILAPADPRPWIVMTSVYEGRNDWSSVVENYREVLARTPGSKEQERSIMIGFLLRSGNVDEARREFDSLREESPDLVAEQPLLEGKLLFQEGQAMQALPLLARALRSQPDDLEALLLQGRIQFERGELEGAIKALERVVQNEPLDHESRYILSQAYHRAGRSADSQQMLDAYRNLEAVKQKLYVLESVANSNPQDRKARETLVQIFDQLGANSKADYWRRSLGPTASSAPGGSP